MTAIHKLNCWICGRSVSVRESKIEENGYALHESCYIAKLALKKGQSQVSKAAMKVLQKFKGKKVAGQELITDIRTM
jgi:hypothetical protein